MVVLKIKVKPNAKQQNIIEEPDGSLKIALKSPPIDGKANRELIKLLAKKFGVAKSEVIIKSGLSSRNKLVELPLDSND